MDSKKYFPALSDVMKAEHTLSEILEPTPLQHNRTLSDCYDADVLLKREDLQMVRSYKIRGAYNKIRSLDPQQAQRGVVCASAGNHAQGVAYSCSKLGIRGRIFMPVTTPKQKRDQVRMFGGDHVEIVLVGDTFDAANQEAIAQCERDGMVFIPPFDDPKIIEGQGTVALEVLQEVKESIDYVFVPVGGGGLISGVGSVFRHMSPSTKIIGVEPAGAAGMKASLAAGHVVTLDEVNKFVDGAAVQTVGQLTFSLCRQVCDDIIAVPEGKVCTTILRLYNSDAIVVEPAGALSIAALDFYKDKIKGKNVVCIVSGSNNDITRMEEIKGRSLLYEGLKHYFIVNFPQRSGALKSFVTDVLGPTDDITFFEYKKKTAREKGPALIGIEVQHPEDFHALVERMDRQGIVYQYVNDNPSLFELLI
ncbi:MAG TPA: threonine ammonia-lyase [Candidatus Merdimorpha stercoravium]|uniref:L-threonine dehydratase n=1 Tax=Candidatus Merdimorpha stercoravium TaxID=2840863 RepID=A0A9D1KSD5_9FLAO|nr:threonine ammonia-lyase [Candidatus Merdimorpha stercoravium]